MRIYTLLDWWSLSRSLCMGQATSCLELQKSAAAAVKEAEAGMEILGQSNGF